MTSQGNVQFESDGESVRIQGLDAVSHISELTATNPDSIAKSLLYRTVATGGGEVIEKGHTEEDACFGRDAFAKVLLAEEREVILCLSPESQEVVSEGETNADSAVCTFGFSIHRLAVGLF